METTEEKPNGAQKPADDKKTALMRRPEGEGTIDAFASEANFVVAARMGKALADSTLVPDTFRNNLPNVMIAMEVASRIRASVFAVMQNMDVIHGRPSFRATFLIATVNASGRFTPLRFRFEGKPGAPDYGCRAVAKDRESGEECIGALITMALANAEGWSTKNGSKWKTMPEQMIMYRAAAFWQRVYAPELGLGMGTTDEAEDIGPSTPPLIATEVQPVPGSAPEEQGRRMSLKREEKPAPKIKVKSVEGEELTGKDEPRVEREPGEDDDR